ncbi:hypothetical protein ITJ43_04355 [Microbacterium sp. VKM Ac-2870]|uniref:DUF6421 family protein n=1 Tax=Microbacterium sp. VKM Ac-2870 TaxID=2783825 RepID=UPI00188ACA46|nr:DUF6421 family protein [Microbacterium sp. VKM Ac-2870]MBF4561360.1 hypothetical protein [Microbacterium sp. VKM Ac-2870]
MSLLTSEKSVIGEPEVVEDDRAKTQVVEDDRAKTQGVEEHSAWLALKQAVTELQPLQVADGSIPDAAYHPVAAGLVDTVVRTMQELAPLFPHDDAYLSACVDDLRRWTASGFDVPDFLDSLVAFQPQRQRIDGLRHLVVFPMYTQNGSRDRHLEAVLCEVIWPEFIGELEQTYTNGLFVSLRLLDFTSGYDTNSAVLFPETVAMREIPSFTWGAIFQDREAARFRRVVAAASEITKLDVPEGVSRLLADQSLTEQTFVMWDLIHDRSHMRGDLPFDPFMIKQRMPFFLYSLEELRCDLTAYRECVGIAARLSARDAEGETLTDTEAAMLDRARLVQYAVLFDRIFRFAITGSRVRNYDGLGGQLLFAWLHQRGVLHWTDTALAFDWDEVPAAVIALSDAIDRLYWESIDRPKVAHWLAAYELVRGVVAPHPASAWARGLPDEVLAGAPKGYTDAVLDDEFPLSMFFEALDKKMRDVIASTAGITGRDG